MSTILITGANRGLGLEFARQYAVEGWRVLACCRDPDAAGDLTAIAGEIERHRLDVADQGSIDQLAVVLGSEPIDILLNNAGINPGREWRFGETDPETWIEVLRINALGPMKMAERFADNVAGSECKKIMFISSRMGSIGSNQQGGNYCYRASKSALNALMKSMAVDLAPLGIIVAAFHPGWVQTDMGGPSAPLPATDSAAGLRRVIAGLNKDKSGGFYNYDGEQIPW